MKRISQELKFPAFAVCLLFVLGCQTKAPEPASENQTDPSVEVFSLTKKKLPSSIQIPGELIAYQQVDLYAKVNSFVQKLYADVGSEVRTGQLLAIMDAPEINSQLAGAESKLKSLEATYMAA